jgi:hypothetical protein
MNALINILIRTSNRPQLFARCLQSIHQQTYQHYRIIVGYDRASALDYIPQDLTKLFVYADNSLPYFYDCYSNDLKTLVTEGWFMFLDDDDTLTRPTILEELAVHLQTPGAIICQFLRNSVPKPAENYIRKKVIVEGKIGLPCMVLHSKYKMLSGLDGQKAGDYRYIKEVTSQVPTNFIELPLVTCDRRSRGHMEPNSQNIENSGRIENKL